MLFRKKILEEQGIVQNFRIEIHTRTGNLDRDGKTKTRTKRKTYFTINNEQYICNGTNINIANGNNVLVRAAKTSNGRSNVLIYKNFSNGANNFLNFKIKMITEICTNVALFFVFKFMTLHNEGAFKILFGVLAIIFIILPIKGIFELLSENKAIKRIKQMQR